jgi:hypothetical protein
MKQNPFLIKLIFQLLKRHEFNRHRFSHEMSMVGAMLVVKTDNSTIITRKKLIVDVRKVISDDITPFILPRFSAQLTIAPFVGNFVPFIANLSFSHDAQYPY